jgi:hypothetical protein
MDGGSGDVMPHMFLFLYKNLVKLKMFDFKKIHLLMDGETTIKENWSSGF